MNATRLEAYFREVLDSTAALVSRPETYTELLVILTIYLSAYLLTDLARKQVRFLRSPADNSALYPVHLLVYRCGRLLFPLLAILALRVSVDFIEPMVGDAWLIQIALIISILLFFYSFTHVVVTNALIARALRIVGLPTLFLHLIAVLDDIVRVMESISFNVGNIHFTVYGMVRVLVFGTLLFWFGRASNTTGKSIIRRQQAFDVKTREVLAKLFEITLFFVVFILILQVMGINLTALAVFGGAVGIGLGFGLQSIASNFISGIIILLDRSISLGDYIELDDGRKGIVTEQSMRSTTLETYDGKDIVVPNEKFITTSFTNWTHKNEKQRYRVDFSVSYQTDVRSLVELIKQTVAQHPSVLSGDDIPLEERPDCEIDSFGDSGINMFVEFWMVGIDDGRNRVGGDLLLEILEVLQANGISIPFPQREVRILKD